MARAADGGEELTAAATALYGLLPGEFTAARNARAKSAKASGDRSLGAALGRLPKPSVAAWGLNMLVRHRTSEIDGLLELGRTMRAAQEDLDSDTLRALGTQRRAVIGAIAKQAAALGRELGQRLSDTAIDEIEQTLQAAMADAAAAAALRTGRLVRPLTKVGFEPVELADAVAVPGDLDTDGDAGARAEVRPPAKLADARRKRRVAEARRELESARRRAAAADAEVGKAEDRIAAAAEERDRLIHEREELEERLERLSTEIAAAAKRQRELARGRDEAEDARAEAEREADRAERRLRDAESD